MFMQKLLSRLPFGERIVKRRKERIIKRNIQVIKDLAIKIDESVYGVKDLMRLEKSLNEVPLDHSVLLLIDKSTKVSFYSTSSYNALEAVRKKCYHRESVSNSNLVNLQQSVKSFNEWWSGTESIDYLLEFMGNMLKKSIYKDGQVDHEQYLNNVAVVTIEEEEFLDSILFKVLFLDYISLMILIMEITYGEISGYEE